MASTAPPSPSRRERPAKPALTRAGIVAAAVQVMRTEGLERTTMRRLAQELDTGAASLYVYVRNTGELYAAMLDELLGTVDLRPVTAKGSWQDRLTAVLMSFTLVLFDNPGLAQSALVTRPFGPNALRVLEALLALLDEGDIDPQSAAWAVDLLLQFATATASEHGLREQAPDADEADDAMFAALRNVTPDTYPHIAARADDLISGAGEERLAWGFSMLINGVRHTPPPRPRTS